MKKLLLAAAASGLAASAAVQALPPAKAASALPPGLQGKAGCPAVQAAFASAGAMAERPAASRMLSARGHIEIIKGRGARCMKWGICFIDVDDGPHCRSGRCLSARLSRGSGNNVILEFTSKEPMPAGELFAIESNLAVPAATARWLGARGTLALRKGEYRPTLRDGGRTIRVQLPVVGAWEPAKRARGA